MTNLNKEQIKEESIPLDRKTPMGTSDIFFSFTDLKIVLWTSSIIIFSSLILNLQLSRETAKGSHHFIGIKLEDSNFLISS